jgi:hypothetical protein
LFKDESISEDIGIKLIADWDYFLGVIREITRGANDRQSHSAVI